VTVVCCCASVFSSVYWGIVYYDCGVLLCVVMVYRIRGFMYCDLGILFCVGMVTVYWGFVCSDCGVMFASVWVPYIGAGYSIVTVVCFCMSVWVTVFWWVCVL